MGPCSWPVDYAACDNCALPDDATPAQIATRAVAEQMAAQMLWSWTGQRFGVCEVSARPCRIECGPAPTFWGRGPYPSGMQGWGPALIGGEWFNLKCGSCRSQFCGCSSSASLILPGPIESMVSVQIGATVLPPLAYRVDNWNMLVRLDGGSWPFCQDIDSAAGEDGAFVVTYNRGVEVPVGGQLAAGILACEIEKAICRDKSCQLPQRIQSISRQGVTVAFIDNYDDIQQGRTGIWLIDSWVSSINMIKPRSTVRSPDVPRHRERVTTWPR